MMASMMCATATASGFGALGVAGGTGDLPLAAAPDTGQCLAMHAGYV